MRSKTISRLMLKFKSLFDSSNRYIIRRNIRVVDTVLKQ